MRCLTKVWFTSGHKAQYVIIYQHVSLHRSVYDMPVVI